MPIRDGQPIFELFLSWFGMSCSRRGKGITRAAFPDRDRDTDGDGDEDVIVMCHRDLVVPVRVAALCLPQKLDHRGSHSARAEARMQGWEAEV